MRVGDLPNQDELGENARLRQRIRELFERLSHRKIAGKNPPTTGSIDASAKWNRNTQAAKM
jgi:hypothetical protein